MVGENLSGHHLTTHPPKWKILLLIYCYLAMIWVGLLILFYFLLILWTEGILVENTAQFAVFLLGGFWAFTQTGKEIYTMF